MPRRSRSVLESLCTLYESLASPAGRKKIAHGFIGGYHVRRGPSPVRDERILPSLAGLAPRHGCYPPMNRWAIFFRPAGLAQSKSFAYCGRKGGTERCVFAPGGSRPGRFVANGLVPSAGAGAEFDLLSACSS